MKQFALTFALLAMLSGAALAVPQVVATHAVLAEIVSIVAGDQVEVTTIIPSGFCPGHYDLSPSDYATLIQADLVLYSGFEPWVEQLAGRTKERALVLLAGSWNTPADARQQTVAIADLLSERIPDAASAFAVHRDVYIEALSQLATSLQERAFALGAAETSVVCMQWQASFVSWLGFDVAVTYGLPENLSLRDLVLLADQGRAANAMLVIDNLQSGIEFGGKLAREVNAVHVVLSNFPGALPNTATLLDLLARNAEALFTAIQPIE
ncbi:metal ABC transporter substrate-binding protein [Candidatus Bipolaricaulota bacterium]|nr:metal ABC transporter substrate-binding protein [Candidatus Bipolaricaulota bacterium]